MNEREKVIKELESLRDICNAKSNMAIGKGKIAWAGYANTADDAIALLKEKEPEPPALMQDAEGIWATCPTCGNKLRAIFAMEMNTYFPKFCSECGQEVKWNEG